MKKAETEQHKETMPVSFQRKLNVCRKLYKLILKGSLETMKTQDIYLSSTDLIQYQSFILSSSLCGGNSILKPTPPKSDEFIDVQNS